MSDKVSVGTCSTCGLFVQFIDGEKARCVSCAEKDAEIERLRKELGEKNIEHANLKADFARIWKERDDARTELTAAQLTIVALKDAGRTALNRLDRYENPFDNADIEQLLKAAPSTAHVEALQKCAESANTFRAAILNVAPSLFAQANSGCYCDTCETIREIGNAISAVEQAKGGKG